MLADYGREKTGLEYFHDDTGFIAYEVKEEEHHIAIAYVKPEFRRNNKATELLDKFVMKARVEGSKYITCSCELGHANPETSLKAILRVKTKSAGGFRLLPDNRKLDFYMEL